MVDLYYTLYGPKRPTCLPQENEELARMYRPQKVAARIPSPTPLPLEESKVKTEEVIEETVVPIDKIQEVEETKKEPEDLQGTDIIPLDEPLVLPMPPPEKKPKMEYFSENSISLPGVSNTETGTQPIIFEQGMFMSEGSHKHKRESAERSGTEGNGRGDKVWLTKYLNEKIYEAIFFFISVQEEEKRQEKTQT